ncbi:hypothetical protein ACIQNG_26125 [Streptomyces sp. NPDC091377]|uniref:hypothetical protein n=1 Tax=Streptomyces sp. NPDC091377 TaxID=3365995 RepID=UPI0037F6D317
MERTLDLGRPAAVTAIALFLALLPTGARAQETTVRIDCTPGRTTELNRAIEAANDDPGTRWDISLQGGCTYLVTRPFGQVNGLTAVTGEVRIGSRGPSDAVIARSQTPGTAGFRVLEVEAGGRLTLDRITVRGGGRVGSGGGVFNNFGTLVLNYSTLASNHALESGGGLFTNGESATTTLNHSTVRDGSAGFAGGGLFNNGGTVILESSRIDSNRVTDGVGAGVLNNRGASRLTLSGSTITGNEASETAGGVFNLATVDSTRTLITHNRPNDCAGSPVPVPDCIT